MEVEKRIETLEAEKTHHISVIENISAEKIALDQMLVSQIKDTLNARRELIILTNSLNNEKNEVQNLKNIVSEFEKSKDKKKAAS